jgi:hypothetical protein
MFKNYFMRSVRFLEKGEQLRFDSATLRETNVPRFYRTRNQICFVIYCECLVLEAKRQFSFLNCNLIVPAGPLVILKCVGTVSAIDQEALYVQERFHLFTRERRSARNRRPRTTGRFWIERPIAAAG